MDGLTRERMLSGTDQADVTTGNACWQTPPAVFGKLHDEFGFDLDLFAKADSALMPIWFGPESEYAEDALAVEWFEFGASGFSNPPYGAFISRVLRKANEQAVMGVQSVHLLPLRLTKPVRNAIFRMGGVTDVLLPDKRITFFEDGVPRYTTKPDKQGYVHAMPAMFDSVILVFGIREQPTRWAEWQVPDHVPAEFRRKKAA